MKEKGNNGKAIELQPTGATYSNSMDAKLGDGWGMAPQNGSEDYLVNSPKNPQDESMVLLRFGHSGMPSKAELLDMGTTLRLWAACFIEGDDGAKSFVSSYVKELRHIPDFLDLSLAQAFTRFDANDEVARAATIAKVEEAKQDKGVSAHERERQEARVAEEKKKEEERARKEAELAGTAADEGPDAKPKEHDWSTSFSFVNSSK